MAPTDTNRNAKLSENYRMVTGLPERKDNKPTDPAKVDELELATEPEGGYGGEGGILNTGAINATEARRATERDEKAVTDLEEAEVGEELAAKADEDTSEIEAKTGGPMNVRDVDGETGDDDKDAEKGEEKAAASDDSSNEAEAKAGGPTNTRKTAAKKTAKKATSS